MERDNQNPAHSSRAQSGRRAEEAPKRRTRTAEEAPKRRTRTREEASAHRTRAEEEAQKRRTRAEEAPVRRQRSEKEDESRPSRSPKTPERSGREDAPRRRRSDKPEKTKQKKTKQEQPETAKTGSSLKKRRPHRLHNTNFGVKFVTMLAVVAAVVFGLVIFFKVQHIQVEGNAYYTADEIAAASGIALEDNLLTLSKATAAARIRADLPYVSEVQIKRALPNTVVITVTEFEVTYGIQDEINRWWLINREGRVLDQSNAQEVKDHVTVQGLIIQSPEIGDEIRPAAAEGADMSELASKKNAALTLLQLLEPSPFAKQIVSVDVSTSYDILLWYGTQYQIKLGNTEELAYKMQYLQAVLQELASYQSGVIDLTFTEDKKAHFQPFG